MLKASLHPGSCAVLGSRSTGFGCSTVAAFEAQFAAQAGIGVHDQAEAHERVSDASLKKPCGAKRAQVHALYPRFLEQTRSCMTMKGPPNAKPNLDDVLARDFAELKVGEANIKVEEEQSVEPPAPETVQPPVVYNQKIDAIEDRTAFSVAPPSTGSEEEVEGEDEAEEPAPQEVLQAPTSSIGDDFDVAW